MSSFNFKVIKKQPRSSKYMGFLKIEAYGMPHPSWIFVKTPNQVDKFITRKAEFGWTVRTCLATDINHLELNLPFFNHLPPQEVKSKINEIKQKMNRDIYFVIYPSWEFLKSGNYLLLEETAVIEAIDGFLGELTNGIKNPKVTLTYDRFSKRLLTTYGDSNFLSQNEILRILKYNTIIKEDHVTNEWSITTKNEFYFHHWIEY
jgi:hypothetical protein